MSIIFHTSCEENERRREREGVGRERREDQGVPSVTSSHQHCFVAFSYFAHSHRQASMCVHMCPLQGVRSWVHKCERVWMGVNAKVIGRLQQCVPKRGEDVLLMWETNLANAPVRAKVKANKESERNTHPTRLSYTFSHTWKFPSNIQPHDGESHFSSQRKDADARVRELRREGEERGRGKARASSVRNCFFDPFYQIKINLVFWRRWQMKKFSCLFLRVLKVIWSSCQISSFVWILQNPIHLHPTQWRVWFSFTLCPCLSNGSVRI